MKVNKELLEIYTHPQVFFLERYIEQLHRQTIDSYKIRLLGPLSILKELVSVIIDFKKGIIFNFDPAISSVIKEAKDLIKDDNVLSYPEFTKEQYINLLDKADSKSLAKIKLLTRLLIEYNKNYLENLFLKIEVDLNMKGTEPECLFNSYTRLDKYTSYLCSELVSMGYSTRFLYRSVNYLYGDNSFIETFKEQKKFFLTNSAEKYSIYFKCNMPSLVIKHLKTTDENIEILEDIISAFNGTIKKVNKDLNSFINPSKSIRYFKINVNALDYFMAFKEGRNKLGELFDIINIGFNEHKVNIYDKVLIVPDDNHDNWEYLKYNYELDGNYKKGEKVYDIFSERLKNINNSELIDIDTKEKLVSAIRYFRLGTDSVEVEHEFLNYWFGLEYLYSSEHVKGTVQRIKDYFKKIHALGYTQRLFNDFKESIIRHNLQNQFSNFKNSPQFVKNFDELEEFYFKQYDKNPLIAFRARLLKRKFLDGKHIEHLKRHEQNLEHHLTRVYRTRNLIVHDAAKNMNILLLTSSLKYYLANSIDIMVYWLTDSIPIHSIEDILQLNETLYEKHLSKQSNIEDLLNISDKSFLSI
ncbi:MAG: hypothetical protein ACOYBS_12655 [Flavobacterium sp.]